MKPIEHSVEAVDRNDRLAREISQFLKGPQLSPTRAAAEDTKAVMLESREAIREAIRRIRTNKGA